MKKRLMSTLLMGAFFLASTSMFVSCKDYDDDINANTKAIQNVETSLKEQIATLNSALQQEKTAAAAAHSQYEDAIAKAQAAADAANKSLSDALVAAATHATTSYVDDAVSKGTADKATVSQLNDAIGNLQTTLNAAIDGKASTADLNSAIAAVNDKIAALQGDIAAATNAQSTLSATLTAAINAVDQKVDTKASTEAVNALSTVLTNVQQSMQTKADVQEAIAAATANLATNASVAEKIQVAAAQAASDVNLAKKELEQYADKAATAAATEAAATAKAEAIASAIQSAQNLEEKLTTSINQLQKDGAAADAQLQKNLNDSVAVLVAKIGGINTNLSSLIDINKNAIAKNMAAIENINLQIDALNRFTGLLEDKNVVSLKDSLRLTYAELQAAKQTLGDELIRIETKVDQNALAYAAALLTQKNELTARIDSLRDNYATDEELEAAIGITTLLIEAVDDRIDDLIEGDITTLKNKVKAIEDNIGEASIAAMLQDIEDINKTITVSGLGKIENLDEILEDLQGQIDDLDGALSEYKEKNDARVKALEDAGFISETAIDGKIATAVSGINTELGKYVQKAEIDQFLTGTKVVAALQTAGFALSSDLDAYVKTETLDNYLKKADLTTEAIEALGFITGTKVQEIANAARDEAKTAANEDLQAAINAYDAQLAAALKSLFAQITGAANEGANGDDEAVELPEEAKKAIEELKEAFEETGGLSPQIATEINTLWITLDGKLTSLVFYPESYYGGIESIEITALKIDNTYGLKDTASTVVGTAWEEFEEIAQKSREFDLFPNGYAKYHINPVNADLTDYTLAFIDHTATTRSATNPYLKPVETAAAKNYRDANDVLWVEFENNAEIYNEINNASGVPSMGHNTYSVTTQDGREVTTPFVTSHFVYGNGTPGKGIVTALTAHKDTSYVASDYALIVPVTINSLVLANTKFTDKNSSFETSDLDTDAYSGDADSYTCNAANKFHLHRKVLERIGDDNAVNKLMYNEQFDLTKLVETHFVNNSLAGADDLVDDDLFRRLNLAYRFFPIDYDTEAKYENGDQNWEVNHHYTSESKFITLTGLDENGDFNGIGYFNQVKANKETNGEKVKGASEFGEYKTANDACIGRQPVVRVELYRKDKPEYVYAIGYLKLEIADNVEKDVETFSLTASDQLLATCDDEACGNSEYGVVIRWDEIQEQLNDLRDGQGLKPAAWNTYEVEEGTQYVFDKISNQIIKIDQSYDKDSYPYYQFGTITKTNDKDYTTQASGVWTDVLEWTFCEDDWKSLYFDLMYSGSNAINENGVVTVAIKRYVKLTSADSANPDLYVGIEIPANSIHFPAGVIGKIKKAYWYDAATANEGRNDMILNVDLNIANAHNAALSPMVDNGWFYKQIVKNFDGEQIKVDLTQSLDELPAELKEKAEDVWSYAEDYYLDSKFYFRMPDATNAKEKVVYNGSKWQVKGISGNTYTLMVTDLEPMCEVDNTTYYWSYGSSVSIVEINGVAVTADRLEAEEIEVQGTDVTVYGYKFLTVDPETSEVSLKIAKDQVKEDQNSKEVGDSVAGYSQDMLNYARHNWSAIDNTSGTNRPYNLQLTSYMVLIPTNYGATMVQPSQMLVDEDDDDDDDDEADGVCYILPGYMQSSKCTYCYEEVKVNTCMPEAYRGCFAPIVNDDNKFTVRFLQPVYIQNNLTKTEITDAMLGDVSKMNIPFKNFLALYDWAEYFPSTGSASKAMANFINYYGVKISEPEELTQAYWDKKYADEVGAAKAAVEEPADGFAAAVAAIVETLNAEAPTDADGVLALYTAAKEAQDDDAESYPPSAPAQTVWVTSEEEDDESLTTGTVAIAEKDIVTEEPGDYEAFTTFKGLYTAQKEADYQLIAAGIMDFEAWLADNDDKLPKYRKVDAYGYSDTDMDGTVDPYTAANAVGGTGAAYVKTEPIKPKLSDFSGEDNPADAYATAFAAWQADTCNYNAWVADCETYQQYYGVKRTMKETDDATDDADATKHWNKFTYEGRTSDAVAGRTMSVSINTELNDPTRDYTITRPVNFALTADNWGIEASKYKSYLDYLDSFQRILDSEDYTKYKAARDAYVAAFGTNGTVSADNESLAACANYYYYLNTYKAAQEGESTALKDFTDYMEDADNADEDENLGPNALVDEDGNWASDDIEQAVNDYYEALDAADDDIERGTALTKNDMYLTDLTLSNRTTPTTLAALKTAVKNAKPISEVAPLDLKFAITNITALETDGNGIKGQANFTYNNNGDVNNTFNIYVPFDVTYNYLDRSPARKVRVWAIVTVKATTANPGARRK